MLTFGKYQNHLLEDVYQKDPQYLKWLNTQPWFKIKFKDLHLELNKILVQNMKPIKIEKDTYIIYTDGACTNNGQKNPKAGIGIHFGVKNKIKIEDISLKLQIEKPTNNKAELTAIGKALEMCNENNINDKIIIFTDSQYSIKCITLWYPDWLKKKDFKNKKNIDILRRVYELYKRLDVQFEYIKAHTGFKDEHSQGNSVADHLATKCL
jgi:ribonuclease HI